MEPTHPGSVLKKEFIDPMHISLAYLIQETGIPEETLNSLIANQENISSQLAEKLSSFFGTPASFWIKLQENYEDSDKPKLSVIK